MIAMVRWLGLLLALGLVAAPAEAQVFKPKGKKTETAKKAPAKKAPAKKASAKKSKKATKAKARKSRERTRSDEEAPARSKRNDPDFVKITDDDEIE